MTNFFESMRDFSRSTKTVRMAAPEDIIREVKEWSDAQLQKPILERGEPAKVRLEIKPGAPTMDFKVMSLTMSQREQADAILDTALPPQTFVDEPGERPGQAAKRIPTGYDYEDPKYLNAIRALEAKQAAYVALKGVVGLEADTPGSTDDEKVKSIMEQMPTRLVKFLAGEIWTMTYAQGDPADFFTNEDSVPSPSSQPSPSKNPRGPKRK